MTKYERSKKSTAHLICGYIGAGKTTFAKKLQKETGALRFTKDEWLIRIIGNDPKVENFDLFDGRMTELVFDVAFECLKAGNEIILDDGIWVWSQRQELYQRVLNAGGIPKLYYIKTPDHICKERALERSKHDSFIIDEKVYESYIKYFEPPREDEKPIVVIMNQKDSE